MNPQNPDHADLTTYAMGELPHDQELEMRAWIAAHPEAQAELVRIEQITDALHHGAPIPTIRLNPQQRQTVLTPPKGPRIVTPMMPRQPMMARRQSRIMPFLAGVTKIAAVLAVAAGGYLIGKRAGGPATPTLATTEADASKPTPRPQPAVQVMPLKSTPVKEMASVPAPLPVPPPAPVTVAMVSDSAPALKPATPATAPAAPTPTVIAQVVKPAPVLAQADTKGYSMVSREQTARVIIRPYETRPVPVRVKGEALASPISPAAATQPPAPDKGRAPDLYIQSWKAEVASCPWNHTHKLMRVLVQLPADQPASTSAANVYPLQVSFDNLTVRSYRLLSENHVPPQPGTNSAAHVMWYEVVPNGSVTEANRETGRSVATITVPSARFNSQTVGPFDSSKLQVLDRGVKWENAREDFLFETSIVGFGLLLRGEENLGTLNHELVLKIAEKAQGDKAADGERAKFIKLVQEAKRVTGI